MWMKNSLTIIVFFLSLTGVLAQNNILTQKLTISFSNQTVQSALESIEKKTSIAFIYNSKDISEKKKVYGIYTNKSIEYILNKILNGGYSFKEVGDQIVISKNTQKKDVKSFSENSNLRNKNVVTVYDTVTVNIFDTTSIKVFDTVIFYDTIIIKNIYEQVRKKPKNTYMSVDNALSLPFDIKLNGTISNVSTVKFCMNRNGNRVKVGLGLSTNFVNNSFVDDLENAVTDTFRYKTYPVIDVYYEEKDSVPKPVYLLDTVFGEYIYTSSTSGYKVIANKYLTMVNIFIPIAISRRFYSESVFLEPEIIMKGNFILTNQDSLCRVENGVFEIFPQPFKPFYFDATFSCAFGKELRGNSSFFINLGTNYILTSYIIDEVEIDLPRLNAFFGIGINF